MDSEVQKGSLHLKEVEGMQTEEEQEGLAEWECGIVDDSTTDVQRGWHRESRVGLSSTS